MNVWLWTGDGAGTGWEGHERPEESSSQCNEWEVVREHNRKIRIMGRQQHRIEPWPENVIVCLRVGELRVQGFEEGTE